MAWLYAPGCPASNSDFTLPLATAIAQSATVSGKRSRPQSWLLAWKRKPWMRLLSGTIFSPSLANSTAEKWTSSLLASRARPCPAQGREEESKTPGGSGLTSQGSLARYDPDSCTWRTCEGLFPKGRPLEPSSVDWPAWGTMRSGVVLPQLPLVPATSGNGYSSWVSPQAQSGPHGYRPAGPNGQASLDQQGRTWPSPRSEDSESCGQHPGATDSLNATAKLWTTPQAHDLTERGAGQQPTPEAGNACRAGDARLGPTAAAANWREPATRW